MDRLQAAAFELFADQGFERTTVAEIARQAGLTQRTFFNYFPDKREVLFGLSAEFEREVVRAIAAQAEPLPPLEAAVHALGGADMMFEERRVLVTRRQEIIDANPELQERELSKLSTLTNAIAAALRARGVESETAHLAASTALLVQQAALRRWLHAADGRPLGDLLLDALDALRSTVAHGSERLVAKGSSASRGRRPWPRS